MALVVNNPLVNVGDSRDRSSIPGLGRFPAGGVRTFQYPCLENPTDRGAWWAMVHRGHKELDTSEAT